MLSVRTVRPSMEGTTVAKTGGPSSGVAVAVGVELPVGLGAALVAVGVIGPKWDWRQRQLEGRYLGREQAAVERQRRTSGLDPVDLAETAVEREAIAPGRIVPAWTLASLAAAAAAASAFMLWRERR